MLTTVQAADPGWESLTIEHPALDAHLHNSDLLPGVHDTKRRYITSFDPATALHLMTALADNEAEIHQKIQKAVKAQKTWKHTSYTQRRRVIRSLNKWLVDNQESCAKVACRDTGKTRTLSCTGVEVEVDGSGYCLVIDAALGEIITTCSKMEWLIQHGERVLRPERRSSNLVLAYKRSEVHFEPLGVVAGIVSWNYRTSFLPAMLFHS